MGPGFWTGESKRATDVVPTCSKNSGMELYCVSFFVSQRFLVSDTSYFLNDSEGFQVIRQ